MSQINVTIGKQIEVIEVYLRLKIESFDFNIKIGVFPV